MAFLLGTRSTGSIGAGRRLMTLAVLKTLLGEVILAL